MKKTMYEDKPFTTWKNGGVFNVYPVYDWKTSDIWIFSAKCGLPYNHLYDLMYQAGLTIHQMRICQPYGDDQRKGLWLFHIIEPETWGKVVARVNGANTGAIYVQESGNILGNIKITKPAGHTWQSFAMLLLKSMPAKNREQFENKIAVFLHWYSVRGYPHGIPDEGLTTDRNTPSWTRICKALLRNDYWCKGLSFSQHKSEAFEKYRKIMKKKEAEMGNNVVERAMEIFRDLTGLDEPERIETINAIRLALHGYSPFKGEPVDCVLWVESEAVQANDYNPNAVAPPEMELLRLSIREDGYTQPIVAFSENGGYTVVDGFHRNRVGKECPDVRERIKGYLPIAIIRSDREEIDERIASTIRHNRARGKHTVEGMSNIVLELSRRNWSDMKIAKKLGMDADEVLRLKQITGLAELFTDKEFSEAWEGDI